MSLPVFPGIFNTVADKEDSFKKYVSLKNKSSSLAYLCYKKEGSIIHFDIVPVEIKDEKTIHTFGKDYLLSKNLDGQPLTAK